MLLIAMAEYPPMPERRPSADDPPPRAFSQGVGLLLQTAGMLLFLSSCCVCGLSGLWDQPLTGDSTAAGSVSAVVTFSSLIQQPAAGGAMLTVVTATLAGLAMVGFGLGLQAERHYAAAGATTTTLLATLLLLAGGVGLWIGGASWSIRLWNHFLLALFGILSAFTIVAWREARDQPPPENVDVVPPDHKIPYSWYHDDPPDVRLEREIAERRARLEAEQRELDRMQRELNAQRQNKEGTPKPRG